MKKNFLRFSFLMSVLYRKYQLLFTFLLVVLVVMLLDILLFKVYQFVDLESLNYFLKQDNAPDVDIPSIWLDLLTLVLGTLIVVISIASQSTPKLIDLYIKDQTSLFYIWFIACGSLHNLSVHFLKTIDKNIALYKFSLLVNNYVLLPIGLILAVPYILYILRYTKNKNVIEKLFLYGKNRISRLENYSKFGMLDKSKNIAAHQALMFDTLNQLDELLKFNKFKEPQADIIHKISQLMQQYLQVKKHLKANFFEITSAIRNDISFKTITDQLFDIEKKQIFYEQKTYRIIGNAYFDLMETEEFDLASLCIHEVCQCGKIAIKEGDTEMINATVIRFNTFLRFGIKHVLRKSEPRNLYNAIFHYGKFIDELILIKDLKMVKQTCVYLNIYLNEIYRHSQKIDAIAFLVDVFAWELKKLLVKLYENSFPTDFQQNLLEMFLKVDNLTNLAPEKKKFAFSIRVLQCNLALYYLQMNEESFVKVIIADLIEDKGFLGKENLRKSMQMVYERIKNSSPTFWEDTDRGNINLYYSENKEMLAVFEKIFEENL
ncbi:MAG: hypothetical protein EAZ97_16455 [Bacteroidetes bacterium]|nr:MAG: hypothetical protein EAZ97_16455 [Bacteroidota bacterium]